MTTKPTDSAPAHQEQAQKGFDNLYIRTWLTGCLTMLGVFAAYLYGSVPEPRTVSDILLPGSVLLMGVVIWGGFCNLATTIVESLDALR
jgi:hypothetical protein